MLPILASILDLQLYMIALFWVISRCLGSSPAVLGHLPRSGVNFCSLGFVFGPFLDYFRPHLVSIFCFGDHYSMILGSFVRCLLILFFCFSLFVMTHNTAIYGACVCVCMCVSVCACFWVSASLCVCWFVCLFCSWLFVWLFVCFLSHQEILWES